MVVGHGNGDDYTSTRTPGPVFTQGHRNGSRVLLEDAAGENEFKLSMGLESPCCPHPPRQIDGASYTEPAGVRDFWRCTDGSKMVDPDGCRSVNKTQYHCQIEPTRDFEDLRWKLLSWLLMNARKPRKRSTKKRFCGS